MPIISNPGYTVLPGLIDSHTHALGGNVLAIEQTIRFGVTTVCDMHNEAVHIHKLQMLTNEPTNKGKYSDFKCAGTGAIIEGGWPGPVVKLHGENEETKKTLASWPSLTHPSEAAPFVQDQITTNKASYIKLFHELGDSLSLPISLPAPPLPLQHALVLAAHEHNLPAVGHAFSHAGALALLHAGVDGLTHVWIDKAPDNSPWLELLSKGNVFANPTLSTAASQTGEGKDLQVAFAADPLAKKALVDPRPREPLGMATGRVGETCKHHGYEDHDVSVAYAEDATKKMYQAGVPIIVGSDSSGQIRGTAYGLGVHMEIWALKWNVGMKVVDVLKAATSTISERFGFGDRGVVEKGRRGDLVLVEGDVRSVMEDKGNLCLPVKGVWREGVLAEFWREENLGLAEALKG